MGHHQLDALDEQILKLIAGNARIPFLEVARACNVSGEDIIYPQRLILKIICKVLRITSCRNQEKKKNTANLFHINSIFMFFAKVRTIVDLFAFCK